MPKTVRKVVPLPKLEQPKRVAAYARVSSGKDAMLHSLSAQISAYSRMIQQHEGWHYIGVYADADETGTRDNRQEFQRLLSDCRAGEINIIITKSISRFARNTVTLLQTVRELKALGVDVHFQEENIHSMSADGELMLSILASYAQEESRSVSENCKWRIRDKFKRGEPTWFRVYGYRMVNQQLEVHPEEAEVVKKVFRMCVEGAASQAIANRLQEMKIPAPDGDIWQKNTVNYMLRNERYIGDLLLQKSFVADHLTKRIEKNRGELPMYYAQGTHQAIIDKDTFSAVQERCAALAAKHKSEGNVRNRYIFSGMLLCGKCGAQYRRKINAAGTKYAKVVWICNTYNTRGKKVCASKQIPDSILAAVTAEVLGADDFDQALLTSIVERIDVTGPNELTYRFYDGVNRVIEWRDHSRADSWTPAMREKAAEQMRRRHTHE